MSQSPGGDVARFSTQVSGWVACCDGPVVRWPLLMVVVVGALFLDRIPTLGNVRRDRGRQGQRCPMGNADLNVGRFHFACEPVPLLSGTSR